MAQQLGSLFETMAPELTNLLPRERIRAFRLGYFFRLAALTTLALALLTAIHGALLLPSYVYVGEQAGIAKMRLAELTASLSSSEEEAMSVRLARLSEDAKRLLAFSESSSASGIVRTILALPRVGITLHSISFSPAKGDASDGRMVLSGIAGTREALRQYHQAVSGLPFVLHAELPLSAYAKETDIAFSMTLTGPLSL